MVTGRRKTGDLGELLACKFLKKKGFRVVERNYLRPWGEIDIIAEKDGVLHFIEVKTISREIIPDGSREKNDYYPEEMVTPSKLHKLERTVEMYMQAAGVKGREYQIDVVGVLLDVERKVARCRLVEQALG